MKKSLVGLWVITSAALLLTLGSGCAEDCNDDDRASCTATHNTCVTGCDPLGADYDGCVTGCDDALCQCLDDNGCECN